MTLVLVSLGYTYLVVRMRPFVPHEHKFTVCGKVLRLDLFNDLEIYGNGLLIVNKLGALIMAFAMPSAVITNDEEGDTDVESGGAPHPAAAFFSLAFSSSRRCFSRRSRSGMVATSPIATSSSTGGAPARRSLSSGGFVQ